MNRVRVYLVVQITLVSVALELRYLWWNTASIHECCGFSPIFLPSGEPLYWNSDSSLSLTLSYVTADILCVWRLYVCVYIYLCNHMFRCPFILELAHKINLFRVPSAHYVLSEILSLLVFFFSFVVWCSFVSKRISLSFNSYFSALSGTGWTWLLQTWYGAQQTQGGY